MKKWHNQNSMTIDERPIQKLLLSFVKFPDLKKSLEFVNKKRQ